MNAIRFSHILTPLLICLAAPALEATSSPENLRATTAIEQAVKADPNNAELWVHLGFAYRKQEDMDRAQSAFEKARSLNPRSRDALYMLGLIYEKKQMRQQARQVWKQYLEAETDAAKRSDAEKHLHRLSQ